jgi:NAD(P)-dependent dehydrogenase (short-subunit alcohol dehydrogenase family)
MADDDLLDETRGAAPGRGRLAGRRILVVGGGQQDYGVADPPIGNGRAMSILFGREGASVAVADINAASAQATAERVRAEGAEVTVVVADASDEEAVASMFADAHDALGPVDGLVLNVGIGAGRGLRGTSVEDWDRVMAVNLRSHFLGCKHALEAMYDGGEVVLIGSVASREVMPLPAYAASKAALEALCRQAAVEAAPRLRVKPPAPGPDRHLTRPPGLAPQPRARAGRDPGRPPRNRLGGRLRGGLSALGRGRVRHRSDADRRRRPDGGAAGVAP